MKRPLALTLIACAAVALFSPRTARADVALSASIQINSPTDFYQPLTPYGTWVDVGSYGRCWHPNDVGPDWQPYTVGSWEWTDAGWYWQSDEPWAWACFHYGCWDDDPQAGWVWIPGTEWAPAWVTWRDSDDYIGWAPCGPNRTVLGASFFTFCDVHHFHDHFNRTDLIRNDTRIINRTRVINDFHRQTADFDGRQRTIYANRGPGVDPIERATGRKYTARPIRDVVRQSPSPQNMRDNERQRPESAQRPEEQRHETPSPTGREQQRTYQQQQPEQRAPETIRPQTPRVPPTGAEQPRNYQQPQQRAPEVSQHPQPREASPPVDRQQPREVPTPEPRHEITPPSAPTVRPSAPAERSLPPTGRDAAPHVEHREAPAMHPAPAAPHRDGGGDGDGHGHDGNKDGH